MVQPQYQPPSQQIVYQQVVKPPSNGMAVTSMILGICAAFFGLTVPIPIWGLFMLLLAGPIAVAAVILGHLGLNASLRRGAGKGNAIAGLVTGYVTIAICVVTTGFWIFASILSAAGSTVSS